MGPTYLVVLMEDDAYIVYKGTDEREATAAYNGAIAEQRALVGSGAPPRTVYLTTVRAEAKLS